MDAYLYQDKRIKELKHQNEILVEVLSQSKHKIKFLEKSVEHLEERWQVLASSPFLPTYFNKLPDIPTLLSFVLKNEKQQVFDNLVDFLQSEYVPDCNIMDNCWSYRQESEIILIWFVTDFKKRQRKQMQCKNSAIISPYFSTGEKGYLVRVIFDPYGCTESRGTHLSCCLLADNEDPCDTRIIFPHEQQFRVTIINLKDRQNDRSAEKAFEMSEPPVSWDDVHYIHEILSLTDVNDFVLNDKLILKIHVKYHSV